jgi:hypothetical protein
MAERVGDRDLTAHKPPSGGPTSTAPSVKTRSSFFKSFRIQRGNVPKLQPRAETGVEEELLNKIERLDLRTQVEAFYTAYSKICFSVGFLPNGCCRPLDENWS